MLGCIRRKSASLPAAGGCQSTSRRVKKLELLKGDSFPIFLVSDRISQQACRGRLSRDNRSQGVLGAAGQCNNFGAPWQCLNFLPEPQGQGSLRPGTGIL